MRGSQIVGQSGAGSGEATHGVITYNLNMVRNHQVPSPGPSSTPGFGAGDPVASVSALLDSLDFLPASGHSFPTCCVGHFPLPVPWL